MKKLFKLIVNYNIILPHVFPFNPIYLHNKENYTAYQQIKLAWRIKQVILHRLTAPFLHETTINSAICNTPQQSVIP